LGNAEEPAMTFETIIEQNPPIGAPPESKASSSNAASSSVDVSLHSTSVSSP